MKTLILALACLTYATSAFASEFTCKVVKNATIYSGQFNVTMTANGIAIRKGSKQVASGPAEDGNAAYELKRNNEVIEEGAEVFLSNDWSASRGGRFTVIDRTRDLGNSSTEFSCDAK
ncbi:MAG: hypothetical protein ACXWR1_03595 [Bdellovibrionota bacterium]